MSDFSELCPLFNAGVYNETLFPHIEMTNVTGCGNALLGTLTCATATRSFWWKFGRTVVVTGGFLRVRVQTSVDSTVVMRLMHFTTVGAAGTEFATCALSTSASTMETGYTWVPFNDVTEKTFTSDEVLGFGVLTGTNSTGGTVDLMIRYREK